MQILQITIVLIFFKKWILPNFTRSCFKSHTQEVILVLIVKVQKPLNLGLIPAATNLQLKELLIHFSNWEKWFELTTGNITIELTELVIIC